MKSVVATSIVLFGALANAHKYPRHFNFRRQNTTESLTSLTVYTTQIETITSCAPTITDCPARPEEQSSILVTNTILLTTTVCPVADAPAISSSVISDHLTGGNPGITITGPLPTDVPTDAVQTPDLTSSAEPTGITPPPASDDNGYGEGEGSGEEGEIESTTTITSTITSTITITVPRPGATQGSIPGAGESSNTNPAPTGTGDDTTGDKSVIGNSAVTGDSPSNDNDSAGNVFDDAESNCAAAATTVTVAASTVTLPGSTVYVTVTPGSNETPESSSSVIPSPSEVEGNSPVGVTPVPETPETPETDEDGEACTSEAETVTMETTVTMPLYPSPIYGTGNNAGSASPTDVPMQYRRNVDGLRQARRY